MFKLNDFYDLLYEKEDTMTQQNLNEPEYFEREKYYTNVFCYLKTKEFSVFM